jgi:hypothetical protein
LARRWAKRAEARPKPAWPNEEDARGAMTDPVAGHASVKRLRRDAVQPGTTVIVGHDPAQGATLRHAPDYYS